MQSQLYQLSPVFFIEYSMERYRLLRLCKGRAIPVGSWMASVDEVMEIYKKEIEEWKK